MATRQRVADGPGVPTTVAGFAQAHGGDGPGVYTIGFGCDGTPFSMDVMRVGSPGAVTTYDIEGLQTAVTIAAQGDDRVHEGAKVTITGQLHTQTGDAGAARDDGPRAAQGGLGQVDAGAGRRRRPGRRAARRSSRRRDTLYRWRFVGRPVAEGSTSTSLLFDLLPVLPTDPTQPGPHLVAIAVPVRRPRRRRRSRPRLLTRPPPRRPRPPRPRRPTRRLERPPARRTHRRRPTAAPPAPRLVTDESAGPGESGPAWTTWTSDRRPPPWPRSCAAWLTTS